MFRFLLRRLLVAIPTLFLVVTASFFMMHAAPGGPFDSQRRLPPEVERNIKAKYGLDKPLAVQYVNYLGGVLRGDLGPSLKYRDKTVVGIIAENFPTSLRLGLSSLLIGVSIGVALGAVAALRQNTGVDYGATTFAILGICIPTFVTAPLLVLVFAQELDWFPTGGISELKSFVLPVITLALPQIAVVSRLTRAGMIEVLHSNYIRTARAKGLSERRIVMDHALRAAVLPLVGYLGPATAGIITGSLVVEKIFGMPGLGKFFVLSALQRDYTVVLGVVILYATLVIFLNLMAEVVQAMLDPQIASHDRQIGVTGAVFAPGSRRAPAMMEAARGRSLWDDALRRLSRNKAAIASLILLAIMVVAAIVGPHLTRFTYDHIDKLDVWTPPLTAGHLLGTDSLGRDLLSRLLSGLGVSLEIGVVATIVSLVIGITWGATAGYFGSWLDEVMMRFVDILYSLPFTFFVILLMVTFGRNFILMFVAIGFVQWLTMARIVRGQTVSLKQREFIEAARAVGLSGRAIIFRHIVPNLLGPVVIYVTLTIPDVIMTESVLSFLGMGVQEPLTSLGTLISNGASEMELAPWLLIFPSIVMVATLMAFNFIGDGLRDAIDPKER